MFSPMEYADLATRIEQRVGDARKKNGVQAAAVHYHEDNDETPIVLHALRNAAEVDRLRADNDRWIARVKELEGRLNIIRGIVR